jgi:hypothetical protein
MSKCRRFGLARTVTLPNLGSADYDNGWPAKWFRVDPGHLFARRFQRLPAVSDWGEYAFVAHASNEFFLGKTAVVNCRVQALAARPRCFLLPPATV